MDTQITELVERWKAAQQEEKECTIGASNFNQCCDVLPFEGPLFGDLNCNHLNVSHASSTGSVNDASLEELDRSARINRCRLCSIICNGIKRFMPNSNTWKGAVYSMNAPHYPGRTLALGFILQGNSQPCLELELYAVKGLYTPNQIKNVVD
jgi:hypothetical protein